MYELELFFYDRLKLHVVDHNKWKFAVNKSTTKAGLCDFNKKTVYFSKYFLANDLIAIDKKQDIVLHEIAHILAGYDAGHNKHWKRIAISIGCSGKRTCSNFLRKSDYKYVKKCGFGCSMSFNVNTKSQRKVTVCTKHEAKYKLYKKISK